MGAWTGSGYELAGVPRNGGTMNIVTEYGEAREYEDWDDAWDAWIYSSDENATLEYVPTANRYPEKENDENHVAC
jgi:hypothetical protein